MRLLFLSLFLISFVQGCRVLSLSGGGAHGAYQAGVLKRLHEEGYKWDIITGVSAGSLNGIALGLFNASNQDFAIKLMESVWMNITSSDVYKWNWNPIYDQSLLDSSPLNRTIYKLVSKYGGVAKRNLILGSVKLNSGLLKLFPTSELNSVSRTTRIVMASSSIPVVFPPIHLDGEYYVDGGTFSNELIRPGVKYCLSKGYKNITIDVIICSPPIQNITNTEIEKDTIIGIMSRAYDVMSNSVFNHELYSNCRDPTRQVQLTLPMYIYKPPKPYPGSMLDFDHKDLVTIFKMGYNVKPPGVTKYCF